MTLQATIQGTAAKVGNGVSQASKSRPAAEVSSAATPPRWLPQPTSRHLGPHRRIGCRRPTTPFLHCLRVQAVSGGKGRMLSCDAWSSARIRGIVREQP